MNHFVVAVHLFVVNFPIHSEITLIVFFLKHLKTLFDSSLTQLSFTIFSLFVTLLLSISQFLNKMLFVL